MSGQVQLRNDDMVTLLRSEFPRSPWGCAFLAWNTVTDANVTGNGVVYTVLFNSEAYDLGNDYASPSFTAPATGVYLLATHVRITGINAANTRALLNIVTNSRTYHVGDDDLAGTDTFMTLGGMTIADMTATHTAHVTIQVFTAPQNVSVYGHATGLYTFFTGHRVA